jgi:hypothetical protein
MRLAGVAAVGVLLAGSAWAGVGVTLKAGTLGLGADLTLPLVASNLNLRAGYNGADLTLNVDLTDAKCEGNVKWQTIPILLDWHPAKGEFRLSAGAVINNNEVLLTADPKKPLGLNGTDYVIEGMDGSITFDQVAWYIGIGSGNAAGNGRVHFAFDLGIMFHGKPKAEATATAANAALQDAINSDMQVEVDKFQKDTLDKFIIYPVISVGISFTFF